MPANSVRAITAAWYCDAAGTSESGFVRSFHRKTGYSIFNGAGVSAGISKNNARIVVNWLITSNRLD